MSFNWDPYIRESNPERRLDFLRSAPLGSLPLELVIDLICLPLDSEEKILLLEKTETQSEDFEDFLAEGIFVWDQNTAAIALRFWATKTPQRLESKIIESLFTQLGTQRLHYTLLETMNPRNAKTILEKFCKFPGISDYSSTFWSLFFNQAIKFQLQSHVITSPLMASSIDKNMEIDPVQFIPQFSELKNCDNSRSLFFDLAWRKWRDKKSTVGDTKSEYWSLLTTLWIKPNGTQLSKLSQLARQQSYLWQIPYIKTLGRFVGSDEASLKLLDYIRSPDSIFLREVIASLAGINTTRSLQEMIHLVTRPNINNELKLEIVQSLHGKDLTLLQNELISAIQDLNESTPYDIKQALMLHVHQAPPQKVDVVHTNNLDAEVAAKIPAFESLSSEVKRSLRTAWFFSTQNNALLDYSPAIDMQYKALELLFRETFESYCLRAIQSGVISRRLDVLGYARPSQQAMDQFENFIATRPHIQDIPFFSKFKLNKLLRSLCQFRSGKRFTLDGIKAFALFFLCFSRKNCPHNLGELVPLGFVSDDELFIFCNALHRFQDFRNRAAHESFRPEAQDDMTMIWQTTSYIIQTTLMISSFLRKVSSSPRMSA